MKPEDYFLILNKSDSNQQISETLTKFWNKVQTLGVNTTLNKISTVLDCLVLISIAPDVHFNNKANVTLNTMFIIACVALAILLAFSFITTLYINIQKTKTVKLINDETIESKDEKLKMINERIKNSYALNRTTLSVKSWSSWMTFIAVILNLFN